MATHDPERFIHLLRDHLAAHDKRIAFLFGAGTSGAVNIAPGTSPDIRQEYIPLVPAVGAMTQRCKEAAIALSGEHAAAWSTIEEECRRLGLRPQIENILSRIRLKLDAAGPDDTTIGLSPSQLVELETTIRKTISALASPSEAEIPSTVPHDQFARWVRRAERRYPIEVFTTNYDILVERSLERARIPIFDGFVGSYHPFFSPEAIESDETLPGRTWTRVWKLHGSTNWKLVDRVPVRVSATGESDMILPSYRKYDESRKMPYLALMDRLATVMSTDGALLITCGYSWNDEHINSAILTALDQHPTNAAIALLFSDQDDLPNVETHALVRHNLFAVASRQAVLQGRRGDWALPQTLNRASASFVDISFDSDAVPEDTDAPTEGRMRLGDFNILCDFLAAMTSGGPGK